MEILRAEIADVLANPFNKVGMQCAAQNKNVVDAYARLVKLGVSGLPPIEIDPAGLVCNGFHRLAAAAQLGQEEIKYVVCGLGVERHGAPAQETQHETGI